jgi:cytochrome b involved in lipid metabolism
MAEERNELKLISIQELLQNNGEGGKPLWCMIHNQIYDLTNFKHPGGRDVLENDEEDNYIDKGREFDSVGHPASALKEMKNYLIGELDKNSKIESKVGSKTEASPSQRSGGAANYAIIAFIFAGIILAAAYVLGKI